MAKHLLIQVFTSTCTSNTHNHCLQCYRLALPKHHQATFT